MPFNFVHCVRLIKRGKLILQAQAQAQSHTLLQKAEINNNLLAWRQDFAAYRQALPGYYWAPLWNMLK